MKGYFQKAWDWAALVSNPSQVVFVHYEKDLASLVKNGEIQSYARLNEQGITGNAMRVCYTDKCDPPVALKISSIPYSIRTLDVMDLPPETPSHSANYEVSMLELLQLNKIPHIVRMLHASISPVQDMLPCMPDKEMGHPVLCPPEVKVFTQRVGVVPTAHVCGLANKIGGDPVMAFVIAALMSNRVVGMIPPIMSTRDFTLHVRFWINRAHNTQQAAMALAVSAIDVPLPAVDKVWDKSFWAAQRRRLEQHSARITSVKMQFSSEHVSVRPRQYFLKSVLSEFVNGGTLSDLLDYSWMNLTDTHHRVILFQTLFTLFAIHTRMPGFRHNDLHTRNILVDLRGETSKAIQNPLTEQYHILLDSGEVVTQLQKPIKLITTHEFYDYAVFGTRVHLPDVGVRVKLWDFDMSNFQTPNEKAVRLHLTAPDTYYDVCFFLNCFFLGIGRTYQVPFSSALWSFYHAVLKPAVDARDLAPFPNDYASYRLNTSHTVPDKISEVMKLGMETIFKPFLDVQDTHNVKTDPSGLSTNY